MANIGPLTDDKDAFRQWDEKMVNVLTHFNKGYGPAIACIKDLVDRGRVPEGTYTLPDSHRGMSPEQLSGVSAVSGLTLTEMVQAGVWASDGSPPRPSCSSISESTCCLAPLPHTLVSSSPSIESTGVSCSSPRGHQDVGAPLELLMRMHMLAHDRTATT